jgi:hypothetical protein
MITQQILLSARPAQPRAAPAGNARTPRSPVTTVVTIPIFSSIPLNFNPLSKCATTLLRPFPRGSSRAACWNRSGKQKAGEKQKKASSVAHHTERYMKHFGVLIRIGVCFMAGLGLLGAQTQIDLRTQGKSVDFSSASSTKPYKTGANLPGSCSVGEAFYLTSAPAGRNLYTCTSTNVWTAQDAGTVTHSTGGLTSGQPLVGNGGGDIRTGSKTGTGTEFVMSESPVIVTPSIGSFANAGHDHRNTAGGGLLSDQAMSSSSKQGNGAKFQMFGGGAFALGDCAKFDATGNLVSAGAACGTGGEVAAQNVGGGTFYWFKQKTASTLQFKSFSAGTRMSITEANDVVLFDVNESALNLANLGGTLPAAKVGSGVDAAKLGAGTVNNTKLGYLANATSDVQAQLDGKAAAGHTHTAGGDLTGDVSNATVTKLQARAVASSAPTSGQTLTWDAATNQWEPKTPAAAAVTSVHSRTGAVTAQTGDYSFSQISGSVPNSQVAAGLDAAKIGTGSVTNAKFGHLSNVTSDIQAQLDARAALSHTHNMGGDVAGSSSTTVVTAIRNRFVSTMSPSNGQVLTWNAGASQWEPQTGSGGTAGVASFNSRTGVVTPAMGDYTFAQITGTAANSQLPPAGGDLNGTLASASVVALRNRAISTMAPASGQALIWNGAANQWEPQDQLEAGTNATQIQGRDVTVDAPSDGQSLVWNAATNTWRPATVSGTEGGVSMATDLGDLKVSRTNASTLSIGSGCSVTKPCNVRFGSLVYSVTASSTATLSSGSGTTYIYINPAGSLIVGHTGLGVACAGASCSAQAGISGFPANTLPLWTWTATSGSWDGAGGADRRSMLSSKVVAAGAGIAIAETGSQTTVSVDAAVIGIRIGVPASATAACSAGNWAVDSNHYYICVATNAWRRAALSSW